MSGTYQDLLTLAAGELNLVAVADSLQNNPVLQQRLLDRLTWMVDSWNISPLLAPWYQQVTFNLVPGQQDYLWGINAPDWSAPRPIRLNPDAANLLLTNPTNLGWPSGAMQGWYADGVNVNGIPQGQAPYTVYVNSWLRGQYPVVVQVNNGPNAPGAPPTGFSPVRYKLRVLSVEEWANISLPHLMITFPQLCYLDRSVVTGTNATTGLPYYASRLSVWGVPNIVNAIEFFYWAQLTVGNLQDPVNASPGYFRAMFLNLAVEIASGFGINPQPLTLKAAAESLAAIKELNAPDVQMKYEQGMPGSYSGYLTKSQFLSGVF